MVSAAAVSRVRSPIRRVDQQAEQRGQGHDAEAADLDQRQDHDLAEAATSSVGVSTTTSPVTHTAHVAVNRAVEKDAASGPERETGSINSNVPIRIATANAKATTWAGCRKTPLRPGRRPSG